MIYQSSDFTPGLLIKNEGYWIWYVLRDLFEVFGRAFVIDTGSTDHTREIVRLAAKVFGGDLILIEEDFGNDAVKIGRSRNVMREMVETEWLFKVDGDEIWREDQLRVLIETDISDDTDVVMVTARNVAVRGGAIFQRDKFNADVLFRPHIYWAKTEYPYEGYDQPAKTLQYSPAYYWHVRHLVRSARDEDAYARDLKRGYFPYDGPFEEMPEGWLGELGPFTNPYLGRV